MFLTPARIKDNRVSNFGSKEWMNSRAGLIEVKALVKPQRNNAVNCQASKINSEICSIWRLDSDFEFTSWPTSSILPVACCSIAFVYSLATIQRAH